MPTDKMIRRAKDKAHVARRTQPEGKPSISHSASKFGFNTNKSPQTAEDRLRAELRRASNASKRGVSLAKISKGKSDE
jgi:hypothetical protein